MVFFPLHIFNVEQVWYDFSTFFSFSSNEMGIEVNSNKKYDEKQNLGNDVKIPNVTLNAYGKVKRKPERIYIQASNFKSTKS